VSTLVLVLATRRPPFPELVDVAKRTWASVDVDEVGVLFYYGGGDRFALEGGDLTVPVADDLPNVGRKTLACFEYVLERMEFDLIFRTNCSTYIDLLNLQRYVKEHAEPTRFYAGKGASVDGIDFATGTGIFLSRDLVGLLVEEQASWDHTYLDDVAIAKVLRAHAIERRYAPRVMYTRVRDARRVDTSEFHFRCKTAATESASRAGDVEIMARIHDAFVKARDGRPGARMLSLPKLRGSFERRS
jgi:hypothetical protein